MLKFQELKNKKIEIGFTIAGAVAGFLYWKFVGCKDGSCAIKSVWYWSVLWGSAVGYLLGDIIADLLRKRKRRKNNG